jgi:alkylhydroperoxidase/carboxymuconolactone decarboxylase family protein YurZ
MDCCHLGEGEPPAHPASIFPEVSMTEDPTSDGSPVLDTLTDMTAASVEHNSLSPRDFILARVAALIAVDAPPVSWYANAGPIEEVGLTAEDVEGIMIAVAPVVGAPRVMAAGGHILRALGFAIAVAEAELEALEDDDDDDE